MITTLFFMAVAGLLFIYSLQSVTEDATQRVVYVVGSLLCSGIACVLSNQSKTK